MEKITISPCALKGTVTVPPSKSAAHRNIILAALCDKVSVISPACHSADIDATINCITALGAKVLEKNGAFYIEGIDKKAVAGKKVTLDCFESGSTLRFMIPVAAALSVNATFIGRGRLPERPITPLTDILKNMGVTCSSDHLPLEISGKLEKGEYLISGDISSQYLTGLLFASVLTGGKPRLTTKLLSKGYVDLTIDILKAFGVDTLEKNGIYALNGSLKSGNYEIEGDWSQACFFLAAGALGGEIEIKGLNLNSKQGDKVGLDLFKRLGADITSKENSIFVKKGVVPQNDIEIDASQIPDMVPSLAVAAALCGRKVRIFGAERLRIKESDRIKTVVNGLKALGVFVTELPDGMEIFGKNPLSDGTVLGANDHRIVMAFSVLAAFSKAKTEITDCFAINKSYPHFFEDFKALGGNFTCHHK